MNDTLEKPNVDENDAKCRGTTKHWFGKLFYLCTWCGCCKSIREYSRYPARSGLAKRAKYISPKCKMYLSKLLNVFVRNAKCICGWCGWRPLYELIFSISCQVRSGQNCKIYHQSKLLNVFVQNAKYICPNYQMYLSKF